MCSHPPHGIIYDNTLCDMCIDLIRRTGFWRQKSRKWGDLGFCCMQSDAVDAWPVSLSQACYSLVLSLSVSPQTVMFMQNVMLLHCMHHDSKDADQSNR